MKDIHIKQKPFLTLHSLGGGSNGVILGSSGGENYWFSLFSRNSGGNMNSFTTADSDAQGNVYAIGYSNRHTGVLQQYGYYYGDLIIVKWNKDGEYQWQRVIGSKGTPTFSDDYSTETGRDLKVGSSGNVYFVGQTDEYNGSPIIGKVSSSGSLLWMQYFGGSGYNEDASSLVLDSSENVYVGAITKSASSGMPGHGTDNIVLVKYNSSGVKQWSRAFQTGVNELCSGVAVDSDGTNYYFCGHTTQYSNDGVVSKIQQANHSEQWYRRVGWPSRQGYPSIVADDQIDGMAVDSSGNVYVVGDTNFKTQARAMFLAKFNSSGSFEWKRLIYSDNSTIGGNTTLGGNYDDMYARDVTVDGSGNVYCMATENGGWFCNRSGNYTGVIFKFDTSGEYKWGIGCGSTVNSFGNDDYVSRINVDSTGKNLLIAGYTKYIHPNVQGSFTGFVLKIPTEDGGAQFAGDYPTGQTSNPSHEYPFVLGGGHKRDKLQEGGVGIGAGYTSSFPSDTSTMYWNYHYYSAGSADSYMTDADVSNNYTISASDLSTADEDPYELSS
tara:strand:+ start:278 stop:1933 length:1656 start_codon:yes stop_codon:yes gene_type:complete